MDDIKRRDQMDAAFKDLSAAIFLHEGRSWEDAIAFALQAGQGFVKAVPIAVAPDQSEDTLLGRIGSELSIQWAIDCLDATARIVPDDAIDDFDFRRRFKHIKTKLRLLDMLDRTSTCSSKIVSNPGILGGMLVIEGTRVPASNVLAALRDGESRFSIFCSYPSLPLDGVDACLEWEKKDKVQSHLVIVDTWSLMTLSSRRALMMLMSPITPVLISDLVIRQVRDKKEDECSLQAAAFIDSFLHQGLQEIKTGVPEILEQLKESNVDPQTESIRRIVDRLEGEDDGEYAILVDDVGQSVHIEPNGRTYLVTTAAFKQAINEGGVR